MCGHVYGHLFCEVICPVFHIGKSASLFRYLMILLIHSASNFGAILVTKMGFFCLLAIIVEVFHCYFQWCSGTKVRNMLLASKMEVYMFLCSDIHNRERCSYLRVPKIGQYEAVVLTQCLRLAFEKAPKAVRSKLPAPSQQVTFQDKVLIKHLSIKK